MPTQTTVDSPLAERVLDRVAAIVTEAETSRKPLEVDPYRGQLFELFVTADGAGYLKEDAEIDLTADGLCRQLSERWGLADATRESVGNQERLSEQHLAKMRLLWSVMRMWMEWSYAWERWDEFHGA
ncbi:hypothetical protein [Calycomorphotria hydatis]|nr:hypothetical protein [Calycomorphotria hydatis]